MARKRVLRVREANLFVIAAPSPPQQVRYTASNRIGGLVYLQRQELDRVGSKGSIKTSNFRITLAELKGGRRDREVKMLKRTATLRRG